MKECVKNLATTEYKPSKVGEIKFPITEMARTIGRVTLEVIYWPIKIVEDLSRRITS
jgi:hypothetical protein